MLRTFIIQACRNLLRNRLFSLINILGLSSAMLVCILIVAFVRFEMSYDSFHAGAENIYRVATKVTLQNKVIHDEANTYVGIGDALKTEFPEVRASTTIAPFNSDTRFIRFLNARNERHPIEKFKGFFVDSSFFHVFTFPLVLGDQRAVFDEPQAAVVSESWAAQYFGDNPIGRMLDVDDGETVTQYKITGILYDTPANSHFKFDLLLHDRDVLKSYDEKKDFWMWGGLTYIAIQSEANAADLPQKLARLAETKAGLKINSDDYGRVSTFSLQPLQSIHLSSHLEEEIEQNGSSSIAYALIALTSLIMIMAWVNYINLATSLSFSKMKSVAISKIVGATRIGSISQILVESGLFNFLSLAIAVVAAALLFPVFMEFVGVPIGLSDLLDSRMIVALVASCLLSTLISGLYPAITISACSPAKTLKSTSNLNNRPWLGKTLVVFQFAMAVFILVALIVTNGQLSFMRSTDLGLDVNHVLVVKSLNFNKEIWSQERGGYIVDQEYERRSTTFKNSLSLQSGIVHVTSLSHLPGDLPNWGTEFKMDSIDKKNAFRLKAVGVDDGFIQTLGLKLLAGRNFSQASASDRGNEKTRSIIINEVASKLIGFKSPEEALHKHITTYWGADYEIIGVLNSFHWLSPMDALEPIYLIFQPRALTYFAINIDEKKTGRIVDQVHNVWTQHFPEIPFNYFFLDQHFEKQYQNDQKLSTMIGGLSALTLVIAGLGLFGLTSHAVARRTREIGIRKVLGATTASVIALFTNELVKLVMIASVITMPVAWWGATRWLEYYAFRISLQWWHFMVPAAIVSIVALVATIFQTVGIAYKNPTESLRNE